MRIMACNGTINDKLARNAKLNFNFIAYQSSVFVKCSLENDTKTLHGIHIYS